LLYHDFCEFVNETSCSHRDGAKVIKAEWYSPALYS
jgi:hypothetical protein